MDHGRRETEPGVHDTSDRKAIVIAARRTPIGRVGGRLRRFRVEDLAAPVIKAVLADSGIAAADVDDVILGNAAGPGGNPARVAALAAGLPLSVAGVTIDRQCGSGLEAINMAARLVEAGAGEIYVAGGVESASTAPWRLEKPSRPDQPPRAYQRARFAPDSIGDPDMGVAAENVARAFGIDRRRQDAYALNSHRKALSAMRQGRFDQEIVRLAAGPGDVVLKDECPRSDTTLEKLTALKPAFVDGGTVTAGNACPINDGAAAAVIVSPQRHRSLGSPPGLRVLESAAAGVDPNLLGIGPVASTRKLFGRKPAITLADVDLVEFNEAFAAQVLACLDALNLREDIVNAAGGAIALGHPFGASGAILVVRLFTEMVRSTPTKYADMRTLRLGLAMLGVGGGLGVTTLFETVS